MSREKPLIRRVSRWHGGAREFFKERLSAELRKAARKRSDGLQSMADADVLRQQLGTRYVALALSEGDLFCRQWWERAPDGWRLRDLSLEGVRA